MVLKVIGTLILGGGLGIPISSTLRKTIVSERLPRILETSDSIVKLEWKESGANVKVGELIDELGKVINGEENDQQIPKELSEKSKPKVLAVRMNTEGIFDENVCRKLGFDSGLKEPPLNQMWDKDHKDNKGIGCYTNLDV